MAPSTPPAPQSEAELCERAHALAGMTLGALAERLAVPCPPDLRGHKGWIGNLMERALGADAGSRDEPDFAALGIELKTLPVNRHGRPVETTFVCTIPLSHVHETPWESSRVRRKLAHVLGVPVEGERVIPLAERRIGSALSWRMDATSEAKLRADWEELAGLIGRGAVEEISGRLGRYLQVRPKARDGSVRKRAIDAEGELIETLPRGFYLRTQFTAQILAGAFGA